MLKYDRPTCKVSSAASVSPREPACKRHVSSSRRLHGDVPAPVCNQTLPSRTGRPSWQTQERVLTTRKGG